MAVPSRPLPQSPPVETEFWIMSPQGYRDTVAKYETEFDDKITLLLESLRTFCIGGGDPHLLNLCNQLDYNKYYSDRM